MGPINTKYEKIVDDLYYMGNFILKFNVSLAKRREDGTRNSFHHEFEYAMNKYTDTRDLVTIRRQFEYFLSIENIKPVDGQKEFVYIGLQDFMQFRNKVLDSIKWFDSKEFENLFAMKDNKIIMLGKADPIDISLNRGAKSIRIEPIVINYEDRSATGVRFYLCSLDNYADMDIDKYMGFVSIIHDINLYQSAQITLNYVGRPEDGTNRVSFNSENAIGHEVQGIQCKSNRFVNNRPKSFFNRIDEL